MADFRTSGVEFSDYITGRERERERERRGGEKEGKRGRGRETHKHVQWQTLVLAVRNVRVLLPEGIS
jgi:hypothetical protein